MNKGRHPTRKGSKTRRKLSARPSDPSPASISDPDFDDEEEAAFLRDVWEPSGHALTAFEITNAFRAAGYKVKRVEREPHHKVWIIRLRRAAAPRIGDENQFHQHVREVLQLAGICLRKKSDLTTGQTNDRALVAFILPRPRRRSPAHDDPKVRQLLEQLP